MEDFDYYPDKPKLNEPVSKGGLSMTIFSMVLFVLVFSMLFDNQLDIILYLLIVLVIHELGHFLLMKRFNYKNVRMLFVPLMGAFVQGKKEEYSQKQSFLVTMAGPFPGIIFGSMLILFAANNHVGWGLELGALFIFLNVLNLLPLDPLDGGQMFKLFFSEKNEFLLMVFALISSLVLIGIGWFIDSFILIIIGFFLGFRVRALQKQYQMHKELDQNSVEYTTTYKLLSNRDFSKIKNVVLEHTPALKQFIDQVSSDEADPVIASQVNNVLVPPLVKDAHVMFKVLVILLWLLAIATPIYLYFALDFSWYNGFQSVG